MPSDFGRAVVAVAPAVYASEAQGLKSDREAFDLNAYVGLISFSGGLTRSIGLAGLPEVRSAEASFASKVEFRKDVEGWLVPGLAAELEASGRGVHLLERPVNLPLDRRVDRTSSRDVGQDNVNLPRQRYVPPDRLPESGRSVPAGTGARYLLVPIVAYYYGHSPGWFNGQEWGCQSGVRLGVIVALYDLQSGRKVADVFAERKQIFRAGEVLNFTSYMDSMDRLKDSVREQWRALFR